MLSHSQSLEELRLAGCPQIKFLSISQPRETEGTSSLGSAVMTSTQDEQEFKLPYNLLCSLKRLCIQNIMDLEFYGGKRDFAGSTSLTELVLQSCPKLVSSLVGETNDDGTVEVGLLPPSLEDLCIGPLPENVQSFTPQGLLHLKKLRLSNGPCLKSVQLHSCTALKQLEIMGCVQLAVLEGSQFLSSLEISGCVQLAALEGLQFLSSPRISGCVQLAVLEGMQFLTSLRSLDIDLNPELSCAWDLKLQEQEQCGNQIQLFPSSLEELKIKKLTDRVQSRLLSCLPAMTKIAILESPELMSLQLGCCTALKELEIGHCSSLASIEGLQFCRNLTMIAIQESPELTSLQLAYCTALKELEIGHCSSLASIEGLRFCRDLTSLKVFNSPGLGSCLELVSHQQGASGIWSGLETLEIDDASVLSTPFRKQLTSLTHLKFIYGGLVSLTEEQETSLELLTSLQELEFSWCTHLLSLPANLQRLTSLQTLSIDHCQSITRLPDMGLPHSLRDLWLCSCSEELGMQCRMAATEKLWVYF